MKINELFEAVEIPARNPKLGYREKARIPVGGTKEWLKVFGATPEHIEQALRVVRQSSAYRAVKALGLKDESTERHTKNGSILFVGETPSQAIFGRKVRVKLTVQANGKIDETHRNDTNRAPMGSKKPHIVPGDPVSSIVKSMSNALEQVHKAVSNRNAKAEKAQIKLKNALDAELAKKRSMNRAAEY